MSKHKELILETIAEINELEKARTDKDRKIQRRKAFRNTELLMKNYVLLKQHAENAVCYGEVAEDEEVHSLFKNGVIYIDAIFTSKVRTSIMLMHVETALEILKANAQKLGKEETNKFDVFQRIYLTEEKYEDLAEEFYCSTMTVRRWKNDMVSKLGVLLFGIDAVLDAMQSSC